MAQAEARSEEFRLPIWLHENRLRRAIETNTVTLAVAGTGVGKSTQIPKMLLKYLTENGSEEKVLCSQPRRLAAVAIAERVATELGEGVGNGQIGYAVGQRSATSEETRCTFMTCGLLLRRLKVEGERVFDNIAFLVMDEVHERSMESDLVLTCVKRLMKSKRELRRKLRIVLVSATLDAARYQDYWNLGDAHDHVNLITLDHTESPSPQSSPQTNHHVDLRYLTRISHFIRDDAARAWNHEALISSEKLAEIEMKINAMLADGSELDAGRYAVSKEHHDLIAAIVRQCYFERTAHASQEGTDQSSTLVFLPTYRALEKQYEVLKKMTDLQIKIEILHSSIDLDSSLRALSKKSHAMRIILATNIAESSVTFPDVYDCIDSCLTNEIVYDHKHRRGLSRVVFASVSQLDQRKGRVGRTKPGRVWRLIPAQYIANGLQSYETPALQLSCLDDAVLGLAASKSRALKHVEKVLEETLDPPSTVNVKYTKQFLIDINALHEDTRTHRLQATSYGQLLADMPVSVDIARFATCLAFCTYDCRGAAVLAAARAAVPKAIIKPFGSSAKYANNMARYSTTASTNIRQRYKRHPTDEKRDTFEELLGFYAAYEFYQGGFHDRQRRCDPTERQAFKQKNRDEQLALFAQRHDLNVSALLDMEFTANAIFSCFHLHRVFVLNSSPLPKPGFLSLRDHVCVLEDDKCTAPALFAGGCAVRSGLLDMNKKEDIYEAFSTIFFAGSIIDSPANNDGIDDDDPRPPCRFYAMGTCRFDAWECRFSHRKPKSICQYFARGYCQFGDQCMYRHETQTATSPITSTNEAIGSRRLNVMEEDYSRHHQSWSQEKQAIIFPYHAELSTKLQSLGCSEVQGLSPDFRPEFSMWTSAFPTRLSTHDLFVIVVPPSHDTIDTTSDTSDDDVSNDDRRKRVMGLLNYVRGIFLYGAIYGEEMSGSLRIDLVLRIEDFVAARIIDLAHSHFFYLDQTFLYDNETFPLPPLPQHTSQVAVYTFIFLEPPMLPNCCLCLEHFCSYDQAINNRRLECGHFLHKTCASNLHQYNNGTITCPLCRKVEERPLETTRRMQTRPHLFLES